MSQQKPEPFVRMTGEEADKNCGVISGFYVARCEMCKSKVILHCDECNVQVSGCLCLLEQRVEAENVNRAEEQADRMEAIRERLARGGLWVPGNN